MGPLITRPTATGWPAILEAAEAEGAEVVLDGRGITVPGCDDGFFLGPSLVDRVTAEMRVYRDEIFGPVLSVLRVGDLDEAIKGGERQSLRQRDSHLHP